MPDRATELLVSSHIPFTKLPTIVSGLQQVFAKHPATHAQKEVYSNATYLLEEVTISLLGSDRNPFFLLLFSLKGNTFVAAAFILFLLFYCYIIKPQGCKSTLSSDKKSPERASLCVDCRLSKEASRT